MMYIDTQTDKTTTVTWHMYAEGMTYTQCNYVLQKSFLLVALKWSAHSAWTAREHQLRREEKREHEHVRVQRRACTLHTHRIARNVRSKNCM